ncbi:MULTISPECIES: Uma2 family endonuclease [unclassified Synechococcus]|uniref:Uma2 family endonuclease n=2 Tax=unclassified Synechococcus TaxID=2626047 RepID=UPI0039C33515
MRNPCLHMPLPLLVVEVVSPGVDNEKHDYQDKRKDYAARGIPVDPAKQSVSAVRWVGGEYEGEVKTGSGRIVSSVLPQLDLSAEDILQARRSVFHTLPGETYADWSASGSLPFARRAL